MGRAIIFDTETTGINDPEIVEAAWIEMVSMTSFMKSQNKFCGRFKPSKRIELGALATHHIMDEDLSNCPPSNTFRLPDDVEYLIGHNIDYDWSIIGKPDVKRICTLALSRDLWPELDNHSQSAMIYHLERGDARELLKNAHSAEDDVYNCRILLNHIMTKLPAVSTWEELWLRSEEARIPKVMPFGKHKGTAINDVPADYVSWLLRQPDIDEYLMKAFTK